MAVGDYLFRLLKANATIDVEAGVPALAGGTQFTWSAVAEYVNVLVTQAAGGRAFGEGTFNQRDTFAVAGTDPSLARSDVRFKVVTADEGLSWLVGRYLMPTEGVPHARGNGGLLGARINRACTLMEVQANAGSSL